MQPKYSTYGTGFAIEISLQRFNPDGVYKKA
ncbi:hypothetical protein FHW89_005118 [Mucilaginibacter sp. SG564]|nr:hypothetical protein [Mucilaginibacter sp. SG564]